MWGRLLLPALSDFHEAAEVARLVDPEGSDKVVDQANAICEGRFHILGFGSVGFGEPVDWHLDPINDRRSPPRHFSRINPLDVAAVGDHKIVWELNRHAFLLTLAQAHALTGKDLYLARAATLLRGWLEHNPAGVGINWVSSLEVAFRSIVWAYVWPLFRHNPRFGPTLRSAWLASLSAHARHIARHTSYYFAPNTHLTGEGLALYLLGLAFPELKAARHYRRLGRKILDTEFDRQLQADGFHYEQSACYHRYTLEFLLLDYLTTAASTFEVATGARKRLERSTDATLPLMRPDGRLVNVGDEDGGQLMPLGIRDPLDARPLLATCALVLGRSDLKAIVGSLPVEVLWLLGPDALKRWDALPSVDPPVASQALPSSGYVAMRDTWNGSGDYVLFDAGPHGSARCRFGHAHADALSIALSIRGTPFIVDPGTGSYVHHATRERLRSTSSHSTAWLDGATHCTPGKPFEWLSAATGSLLRWKSTAEFDLAEGVHDGYRNSPQPAIHRRRVLYWKRKGWLLWDLFTGEGDRRISLQYVLAVDPSALVLEDSNVVSPTGTVSVLPNEGARLIESRIVPVDVSPRYGAFAAGSAFRTVLEARLPTAVATLIRPPGPQSWLRPIRPLSGSLSPARGTECAFHDETEGEHLLVRGFDVVGHPFRSERLRGDGAIIWVDGRSDEILVVGGRNLVMEGRTLLQADQVGDWHIVAGLAHSLKAISPTVA